MRGASRDSLDEEGFRIEVSRFMFRSLDGARVEVGGRYGGITTNRFPEKNAPTGGRIGGLQADRFLSANGVPRLTRLPARASSCQLTANPTQGRGFPVSRKTMLKSIVKES